MWWYSKATMNVMSNSGKISPTVIINRQYIYGIFHFHQRVLIKMLFIKTLPSKSLNPGNDQKNPC